jgi:hypothetical protein
MLDVERNPEEVTAEQNKVPRAKIETRIEAGTSSWQPQNWTVRFPKLIALAPRWYPPGLTHSQRRRIQQMRAQKLKEDVAEKERDEHFNTIWHMFPTNQEWRVKEKADIPAPTTSNDDMDLLDDDESLLIKNGSLPPIGMDINMVFTLPAEFRGAEEEVAQMCLGLKKVVIKKPKESSQHMKPLYVRGHINERSISRMLIDGGAAINLMSYSIFKKLG